MNVAEGSFDFLFNGTDDDDRDNAQGQQNVSKQQEKKYRQQEKRNKSQRENFSFKLMIIRFPRPKLDFPSFSLLILHAVNEHSEQFWKFFVVSLVWVVFCGLFLSPFVMRYEKFTGF